MEKYVLFQSLVGSRAHGLNDEDSDYDYRGVFIVPTTELLRLFAKPKTTSWIEGDEDNTSWELGHFLEMATKCNPTILEAFVSPLKEGTDPNSDAMMLRSLFPEVWNSVGVYNAFLGYGHNQRKKFLEDKDQRANKYAVAYLRTLLQGIGLLDTGELMIDVKKSETELLKSEGLFNLLRAVRAGSVAKGEVINIAEDFEKLLKKAYDKNPDKQTNTELINDSLLYFRKKYWYTPGELRGL